jgi:hypothetical protein
LWPGTKLEKESVDGEISIIQRGMNVVAQQEGKGEPTSIEVETTRNASRKEERL